jgi:hypothetical protein
VERKKVKLIWTKTNFIMPWGRGDFIVTSVDKIKSKLEKNVEKTNNFI